MSEAERAQQDGENVAQEERELGQFDLDAFLEAYDNTPGIETTKYEEQERK